MVSHPKLGSNPPIGSDLESGCDTLPNAIDVRLIPCMIK